MDDFLQNRGAQSARADISGLGETRVVAQREEGEQWELTQLDEHLGVESVYLAVLPARLYLRELHFVLSTRRGWGAEMKLTRQAWSDIEWWLRLPAQSRWNGRKIWRSPTRVKVHTDASLFAWGGVLNLKHAARGFWSDELRHLHITHLELEAVYKTVQYFLRELTGKDGRRAAKQAPQTGLAVGCKVKVYWSEDDAWYTGTVGGTGTDGVTHIAYEDGDKEDLNMSKEKYEVLPAAVQEVTGWDAAL
ncbi:hypothetical protein CYMTET_55982 [Cymbomonas tetramitiformis]|uniref:Uncharacterized protein n=1 Tax=Cymbomonas tetramitiformis TaxID=36881 RepID=A0AAE0EMA1_9CHLO|nr:hypothetical protein CYMTET_55982 [Cymbomonas tetramitiformis]